MVILVNPNGDFPLNDDWSYSRAVYSLVEEGHLRLIDFMYMSLIAQVLWGGLFCLHFGFSFTALRLSTLALAFFSILGVYGLLKEIKASEKIAFLGALLIALNPLFFGLSNTFMTDVPFFAFSILSIFLFMRGFRGKRIEYLAGSLLACLATLIRQPGVIIPLAFGIVYIIKNGFKKKSFLVALFPPALSVGTLVVYLMWLKSTLGLPAFYSDANVRFLRFFSLPIRDAGFVFFSHVIIMFIYMGLFILPFLLIRFPFQWRSYTNREKFWSILLSTAFVVLAVGLIVKIRRIMPLSHNIIYDLGIGPATLRDEFVLNLRHLPRAPEILWLLITVLGIVGAIILLQKLFFVALQFVRHRQKSTFSTNKWMIFFVSIIAVFYFFPFTMIDLLDRHLLLLLPLLMVIVIDTIKPRIGRFSCFIVIGFLLFYGSFSLSATHDYLSWNRARWNALYYLTKECNISYKDIDGGFEFNGWYGYDYNYKRKPDKSWYWVDNDDYILSFGPISGYESVKKYSYQRWLPLGRGNIHILQKHED